MAERVTSSKASWTDKAFHLFRAWQQSKGKSGSSSMPTHRSRISRSQADKLNWVQRISKAKGIAELSVSGGERLGLGSVV
jgi:hypothetical protein